MSINVLLKNPSFWLPAFLLFIAISTEAQIPSLKVDLNYAERQEAEVHEPGYISWMLTGPRTKTIEGVTFSFVNGTSGASWYKTGVQTPYFARFVNDGIKTPEIELQITGLQAGKHSLVTYHNNFDNPETNKFSNLDIYVNNILTYDDIVPTTRVLSNDQATSLFMEFYVQENDTVKVKFVADFPDDTYNPDITICGFRLNSSDPNSMVKFAYPTDLDEHVNIDNDTLEFSWTPPLDAVAYNFYFGKNKEEIILANTSSSCFMKTVTDTFFVKSDFYSMDSYYWRVDPVTTVDTTKGDVYYFKKRIPAFPGAEGYGGYAIGGRGGKVIYVTNLNDDNNPGSFRYAVENVTGPRTILFNVSGLITLKDVIKINDDNITVAGQSAPGKGICFRWATVGVTGNNLIVQNLRSRIGYGVTFDGMGLTGGNFSIVDHCSISWSIDEGFSSRGAKNITLQKTLISEALNMADHDIQHKEHGYAASIGGDIGSFHHNLLAHCYGRNWSMAGSLDGNGYYGGRLDLFNNVCYNWGSRATDGGAHEVNFVNNYYKKGAGTTQNIILRAQLEGVGQGTQSYYCRGNIVENTNGSFDCDGTEDSCSFRVEISGGQIYDWDAFVDEPFFTSEAKINSAKEAYKYVLSDVGCNQPVFDDHDLRMVDETLNGTYTVKGSRTMKPGYPDHEKDAGYWEVYPGFTRDANWDTDLDGLPNWWEQAHGLDTNSASMDFTETNADEDMNGYTNLEEYLQWMSHPHYFLSDIASFEVNLKDYAKGFTEAPSFEVSGAENGTVSLENDTIGRFMPTAEGFGEFTFTVTDAEASTMTRKIGFYVGSMPSDFLFTYSYFLDREETRIVTVDTVATIGTAPSMIHYNSGLTEFQVYPNPATDEITISFDSKQTCKINIQVYNVFGQQVLTTETTALNGENTLDLGISKLQAGIYIVLLRSNNLIETTSFIKN